MAQSRAGTGLPRRWPRRLLIGLNAFVAFCLLVTAVAYGYVRWKFGQIERIAGLECGILSCEEDPGDPKNWLLVGTDSRENVPDEDVEFLGTEKDAAGLRTDTMMVLRVDPRAAKAAILSIPRDLYVPIAGTTRVDRINTAVFPTTPAQRRTTTTRPRAGLAPPSTTTIPPETIKDGIPRLIATIRQNFELEINHYVEVDFIGFRSIVDAVGGVTMPFPAAARDKLSGLEIKTPGCIELDGDQALGFVRSRHLQTFESGKWRTDPTGDIGRIQRQQDFIRRTIRRAVSLGVLANPNNIRKLVNAGVDNVKLDEEVEQDDLVRLGKRFKSLQPDAVEMLTLPADDFRTRNGAAVLKLREAEAREILARFSAREPDAIPTGPVPNIPPGTVRVRVLNGSGIGGQGGKAALALQQAGFLTAGIGDADRFTYTKPVVRYGRGQKVKAQLLAAYVVGGATLQEDLSLRGVDLVLITGTGYGGVRAPGTAAPSTSTPPTTAATAKAADAKGDVGLNC